MGQRAGDDGAEIVEQSGRYALIRDADGVAIYDLDLGSDADPVASYPPGDEGFEAAWERYGRLVRGARRERFGLVRVLGIVVVVGVIVWVVAGVGYGSSLAGLYRNGNGPQSRWWLWFQVADTISYHVWSGHSPCSWCSGSGSGSGTRRVALPRLGARMRPIVDRARTLLEEPAVAPSAHGDDLRRGSSRRSPPVPRCRGPVRRARGCCARSSGGDLDAFLGQIHQEPLRASRGTEHADVGDPEPRNDRRYSLSRRKLWVITITNVRSSVRRPSPHRPVLDLDESRGIRIALPVQEAGAVVDDDRRSSRGPRRPSPDGTAS